MDSEPADDWTCLMCEDKEGIFKVLKLFSTSILNLHAGLDSQSKSFVTSFAREILVVSLLFEEDHNLFFDKNKFLMFMLGLIKLSEG